MAEADFRCFILFWALAMISWKMPREPNQFTQTRNLPVGNYKQKLWCRRLVIWSWGWLAGWEYNFQQHLEFETCILIVSWSLLKVCSSLFFVQKQHSRKRSSYASKKEGKIKEIFQCSLLSIAQWHKITNHKVLVCAVVSPGHSAHYNIDDSSQSFQLSQKHPSFYTASLLSLHTNYSQECNYRNLTLDHLF